MNWNGWTLRIEDGYRIYTCNDCGTEVSFLIDENK